MTTEDSAPPEVERLARELFDGGPKHIRHSTFYTHATKGTRDYYRDRAREKLENTND